jgi:glycerophosphoryl diester phosphodiesterase
LHLTKDGVVVLCHDERLSEHLARLEGQAKAPEPAKKPKISSLTWNELRCYIADKNPEPARFSKQNHDPTPVAKAFAEKQGVHVYGLPMLGDLFAFVEAYAGDLGQKAGKSDAQREHARKTRFSLELKRVPFRPEYIGDSFDGEQAGDFEKRVVELVRKVGVVERTNVQCFDHRSVRAIRKLEPKIAGAVLTANTAVMSIPKLVEAAEAQVYSPEFEFLDAQQVRQAHEAKIRVVPYTVNEIEDMNRLLDWGVDGIITDYPDRLIPLLQTRHIRY